jgi:hypothetical protein
MVGVTGFEPTSRTPNVEVSAKGFSQGVPTSWCTTMRSIFKKGAKRQTVKMGHYEIAGVL